MTDSKKDKPLRGHIVHNLRQRTPRLGAMILALAVCLIGMFLVRKCTRPDRSPFSSALPEKSGGDTLDVAIEISPLSYSLAGDTISGLDYDIIRDLSAMKGRPVKFHPFTPLSFAVDGLRKGNFDIVVSALPSTKNLKDSLLLTDRVYLDREVLVQRSDSPHFINSPEELARDSVWIPTASPFIERLHNLSAEIGDTIHIRQHPTYTAEHLVMLIDAGQIERAVVNEALARRMAARYPSLNVSTPVSFTQFQVWAVSPGEPALRDSLNSWLAEYRETPRYRQLVSEYLEAD